ncbi:MAG: WXG100 family type VII secretion target [Anaerolineae bacterium]|nr:WXG100 family type VII secretion target [Anaerolineae bacterium]MDW8298876.1 WXG100 family type VII secretion target [Anaerolineae bacterium]
MSAPIIQSDYDELSAIERTFDRYADDLTALQRSMTLCLDQLRRGGWRGEGAQAFYDEMLDSVLPALTRLRYALGEAAFCTKRIKHIFSVAETEGARLFV